MQLSRTYRLVRSQTLHAPVPWLSALLCAVMVSACGGGDGPAPAPSSPAAGFTVEVTPTDAIAFAGSGRRLTVSIKRTGGFAADVQVSLANPPEGVTAEPVTFTGEVASLPLQLVLDGSVAPGNLALSVDASGGGSSARATPQLAVQAAQARAQQKIAAALAANSIDRDTSLLYRLYALSGDPRLPDAYVGSGSAEEDLRLFAQIESALPRMSASMQAAMHPFLVRPDHADSIYRRPGTSARSGALSVKSGQQRKAAAGPPPLECMAGAQWRSVRSTTIPLRVWSECYEDVGLTAWTTSKAEATLLVFEKIWTPMTKMMGLTPRLDVGADDNGGDEAIDVYIVGSYSLTREGKPINAVDLGDAYGFAQPSGPCEKNSAGNDICSGYMVLPAAKVGEPFQRSTIVHEFFHLLQFARNRTLAGVEEWFYEASARWVESHYDRTLQWPEKVALTKVHKPWFQKFSKADTSLDSTANTDHAYASYIWPFFLEQENGGPEIIGKIWSTLESAKSLEDENKIIDAAYGFDANFHRFALRNVNEELLPGNPVPKRYVQLAVGQFPEVGADKKCKSPSCEPRPTYLTSTLAVGTEDKRSYGLERLSAKYAQFLVNGEAPPNRVEFDFSGLSNRGSLKIDALIRTTSSPDDEWVSEPIPLNPDSKAVFCFELGKSTTTVRGEFKELRLVLSNSSMDTDIIGDVIVRPTKKPCGVWEGSVDSTQEIALKGAGTLTITSSAQAAFAFDETNSDSSTRVFQVRSGNYRYRAYYDFTQLNPPCRTEQTASGSMHPQGESMDLSDGSTAGALATFVSSDGKPQYTNDRVLTFTTLTEVSNCNDNHVDVTTLVPMSTMALWVLEQQVYDIKQDGSTMQGTRSFPNGSGTSAYTWLLTKKTE